MDNLKQGINKMIEESKNGSNLIRTERDYYKIEHPPITNTDAYLTAPIVRALEKGEGRRLENNELRTIVKDLATKNPNILPEDFEKMLLNYKK